MNMNDAILNTQSAVTELDEKARKIEEELKETNSAKDEASQVLGLHKVTKDALENAKLRIDMLNVLKNSEVAKQSDIDTNEALLNNYLKELEEQKRKYSAYDSAKYVIFTTVDKKGNETDGKIKVTMNEELIKKSLELAGYNMLVTSEISMSDKDVYDAYHNLWRIEESFRIMKSQLDARPVYLQKEDTIVGHFLICYLAVLLTRLLQFKILKNNYCSEDLFEFIHDFRVAKISDRKYINLSRGTTFIKEFAPLCNLPLTSYFLNEGDIKKMLSHRF